MKTREFLMKSPTLLFALSLCLLVPRQSIADIIGPYNADANTLHLWHLDEELTAEPDPGVAGSFNLTTSIGASLGHSSFAGFGTSTSTGRLGSVANMPVASVMGADGAFTFEAILNTSTLNTANAGNAQIILSMDGQDPNRSFQFRLDGGPLGAAPNLKFTAISPIIQTLNILLPTTGINAFAANEWYHAAVTYNGLAGTADNLSLYWTRMDTSNTQANLLGSLSMLNDLSPVFSSLEVGSRQGGGDTLKGFVDEVRISNIARGADDFMFITAVPEPSSLALFGMATLSLFGYRRRK